MPQNQVEVGPGGHPEKIPERGPCPVTDGRQGLRTTDSIAQEAGKSQKPASPSPPRPVPQDPAPRGSGAQRPCPEVSASESVSTSGLARGSPFPPSHLGASYL